MFKQIIISPDIDSGYRDMGVSGKKVGEIPHGEGLTNHGCFQKCLWSKARAKNP